VVPHVGPAAVLTHPCLDVEPHLASISGDGRSLLPSRAPLVEAGMCNRARGDVGAKVWGLEVGSRSWACGVSWWTVKEICPCGNIKDLLLISKSIIKVYLFML
jgi:hypothetical protein